MPSVSRKDKPHSQRIIAVDFWRGICLLMIFINHIPNNPLSMFTLFDWGYADAAEVFVFLAGFSAAIAYGRYFTSGSYLYGILRLVKRTWQLFCANILLIFSLSAVIAAAGAFTDSKSLMREFNFLPIFAEPEIAITRIVKLQYMPHIADILPMYIVYTAMFPLIWMLIRVSSIGTLALSFALWFWANTSGKSFASYPEGMKWFFNPMAWQFLFVCGMAAFARKDQLKPLLFSRALFWSSVAIVLASFLIGSPLLHSTVVDKYRAAMPGVFFLTLEDKSNLSGLRLLDFFAVLFLAVRLLPPGSAFWKWRGIRLATACGRHGLAIYCTGAVMSLVTYIYLRVHAAGGMEAFAGGVLGVVLLITMAWVLEKARNVTPAAKEAPVIIIHDNASAMPEVSLPEKEPHRTYK